MKTWKRIISIVFLILILVVVFCCAYRNIKLRIQKEDLAKELGVKLSDYIYYVFPKDYFLSVLSEDMAISQVHEIINGYTKVYSCYGYEEIYYFYSNDESHALRFAIRYDRETMHFSSFEGEDQDSRTLFIDDKCIEGLLPK